MRIELHVDTEGAVAPGATVSGRVVVVEGGSARTLTVRLAFVERTEDYTEIARVAGETTLATGDLADGLVAPFTLPVPADALPAVAAKEGSLRWDVLAQVDRRGPDVREERPVDVRRTG